MPTTQPHPLGAHPCDPDVRPDSDLPVLNRVSGRLLVGMGLLFATSRGYYLAYLSASSQQLLGPLLR